MYRSCFLCGIEDARISDLFCNVFLFVAAIMWVDVICTRAARLTSNWTGADLAGLARFALSKAIYRTMESTLGKIDKERIKVRQGDFIFGIEERHATKNSAIVDKLVKHRWITVVNIIIYTYSN